MGREKALGTRMGTIKPSFVQSEHAQLFVILNTVQRSIQCTNRSIDLEFGRGTDSGLSSIENSCLRGPSQ